MSPERLEHYSADQRDEITSYVSDCVRDAVAPFRWRFYLVLVLFVIGLGIGVWKYQATQEDVRLQVCHQTQAGRTDINETRALQHEYLAASLKVERKELPLFPLTSELKPLVLKQLRLAEQLRDAYTPLPPIDCDGG